MKHLKKFILILMVLALLPLSVFAADNTLSVFLTPEEEPLSGVSFRIYPVKDDVSDPQLSPGSTMLWEWETRVHILISTGVSNCSEIS